ncbi:MAG: AAA family ATPase [Desulfobacterales bacterium]|nr:AAA family ATPase [Desulfobacterales bacterium]
MITKIKNIGNLAIFENFEWDKSVLDKDNNVCEFKIINVLYGRNYSGKTTLSRILRAMETGELSNKYENPNFCVSLKDEDDITQNNLRNHNKKIRVFNEDFVKDNLKFISNPDESINSFAILGEDNNVIEEEIKILKTELGSKEEDKETGLYSDLKIITDEFKTATESLQNAKKKLDNQLSQKATDRKLGIKYKPERFGDQNYSIIKLRNDIEIVIKDDFEIITNEKQSELDQLLTEKTMATISFLSKMNLHFSNFSEQTIQLVEKKIGASDKIEELVKDAILNRWVKDGRNLHKEKRKVCAFCNNAIKDTRWAELDKHFDKESEILENEIDTLIKSIENEKKSIPTDFNPKNESYYSKFHSELKLLTEKYIIQSKKYNKSLDALTKQLEKRKNDLINPQVFSQPDNFEKEIITIWDELEKIRTDSNNFTSLLGEKQTKAKKILRLREVHDFIGTIQYSNEIDVINGLKEKVEKLETKETKFSDMIDGKINLIETKKRLLKDESKGADKVNEYLNDFLGHNFLSLKAVEFQEEGDTKKQFRFEITRDGKKAYHLSEGECSLIAFCYFMGRLEDVETKNTKPIIWIDDPVSSLDGNHIFFVYSLISAEIVAKNNFEQLFLSTHNLNFLKYLKRLNGKFLNHNLKYQEFSKDYFIINRLGKFSSILLMPEYLKKYVTEFNYLFHQIYACSSIDVINDTNYSIFYNFGNNARKFLEMFLYYKYPDSSSQMDKMEKFFGKKKMPAILTNRINNEYSHLTSGFERGSLPIEVPEMKSAASLILKRIKLTDKEQYESLLKSIDAEETQ